MTSSFTKVPVLTKIGYSVGHVLNDMCAAMWFTYLLLFFQKILLFEKIDAGIILNVGQVADGISTVIVGIYIDKRANFWLCNRFGSRKAWHIIGTVCVVISFPFIFSQCVGCKDISIEKRMVYYSAFVIIFQFGWAAVQISHLSIIPDLTSCDAERTSLTSKRY